jgi:transcriptional regulator NrdR family protein
MAAMTCPLCLASEGRTVRTDVRDTRRNAATNVIVRQRRCPECKAQLVTAEQVVSVRAAGVPVRPLVMSAADGGG